MSRVAGFTSTGSKRPEALFGAPEPALRMTRSAGCRVWDAGGREYLDFIMALGAVALGYGYPEVTRAALAAAENGGIGPFPPVEEEALAVELTRRIPWLEQVRFLKTGAEAMGAAVRLARPAENWSWDAAITAGSTGVRCGKPRAFRFRPARSMARFRSTIPPAPGNGSARRATGSPPSCSSR